MAATSTRQTKITFTDAVTGTQTINAASNSNSPAKIDIVTLASGFNSVTVPTGGSTPVAVTIIPPNGNTTSIILKGITGDTGLRLHNTDPTTVALDPSVTAVGLTAGGTVTGVRLIWS